MTSISKTSISYTDMAMLRDLLYRTIEVGRVVEKKTSYILMNGNMYFHFEYEIFKRGLYWLYRYMVFKGSTNKINFQIISYQCQ